MASGVSSLHDGRQVVTSLSIGGEVPSSTLLAMAVGRRGEPQWHFATEGRVCHPRVWVGWGPKVCQVKALCGLVDGDNVDTFEC
jgi:hypothetical protein